MQPVGQAKLAAVLKTNGLSNRKNGPPQKDTGFTSKIYNTRSHSKLTTDDSDLGKYFHDTIISFPKASENSTIANSESRLLPHEIAREVVNKPNNQANPDSDLDLFDESFVLTHNSQIGKFNELNGRASVKNNHVSSSTTGKSLQSPKKKESSTRTAVLHEELEICPGQIMPAGTSNLSQPSKSHLPTEKCENRKIPHLSSSNSELLSIMTTQDRVKLASWGLPLTILRKYESRGVTSMFPWQVECLGNPQIIENAKNLVYSAPTSAGKTLVSELLVIKTILERRKKVIFVLPFVSVVREKMYYFQDILSDSGVRVEGFMGGVQPAGGFDATDIAIATIEKANSLVNQLMEDGGLENLGAIVIDELHLLGDPHRGYLLELLLTKLKYMNLKEEHVNIQLIGMSATLPNLDLLAKWLNSELYKTDFRPVPLKELCKIGPTVYDDKLNVVRTLKPLADLPPDADNVLQLALETILEGHSVLIFCPTKNWCESLAQQISNAFFQLGRDDTAVGQALRSQLSREAIIETLEQLKRTPVGLDKVLQTTVSFGVAFHHAGLTLDERDVIEGAFRSTALRVLTATSTLSSGVNLPARRVIVRTPIFYGQAIDTLTYKQMIGRAGRMGKDTAGESILICKSTEKNVAEKILSSGLQPIESCLEGSSPLIRALLEAVASEVAYTPEDIATYMKCTLLSSSSSENQVETSTKEAIDFLVNNELLILQKSTCGTHRWVATQLGKACLAASVPPKDGLFLFGELQKARRAFVLDTELHVIYLVTPFNSGGQIGFIDWYIFLDIWKSLSESERRVGELVGVTERFLVSAVRISPKNSPLLDIHKRFYTALALHELVREVPLQKVCTKYGCCRGTIQSLQQTAATFAGMVTQFCKKLGWNCIEILVSQFQTRLQFGVCRDLLDLLRLPMLNGLRARSLFKAGITTVAELAAASEMDVERALHRALPFESEKEQFGEDEYEAAKRNKMRTVFVTGKDGLTPREAAVMLVKEARVLVQHELGLEELQWDQKNRSTPFVRSQNPSNSRNASLRTDRASEIRSEVEPMPSNALTLIHEQINECETDRNNKEPSLESAIEDLGIGTDEDLDETFFPGAEAVEIAQGEFKVPVATPKNTSERKTSWRRSYSESPCLFDDSIDLNTQDCNILEQNILALDSVVFDDTAMSEEFPSPKGQADKLANAEKYVESPILVSLNRVNKTIMWDEESWNNTKAESQSSKQKSRPAMEEQVSLENKENMRTRALNRSKIKESSVKLSTSTLRKSPRANFNTPHSSKTSICTRKWSIESVKSDDDVILPSQPLDNLKTEQRKTRTRLQLESMRNLTRKIASRTVNHGRKTPEKKEELCETRQNTVLGVKRLLQDDEITKISCNDTSSQSIFENSFDDESPPKKINKSSPQLSVIEINAKLKKLENQQQSIPKELFIVNVSFDRIKFNEFKQKLEDKLEISLALACEIYLSDSGSIGRRIIAARSYQSVRKKTKSVDGGIYNDRKLCGIAISWGSTIYYLSFENVQEPGQVSVKERITLLTDILSFPELTVRCFAAKEIYKTLFKCCGLIPACKFVDPFTADWLLHPQTSEKTFENLINEHLPEGSELLKKLGSLKGTIGPGLDTRNSNPGKLRASTEVILNWHILENLWRKLEAINPKILTIFREVEMKTIIILARMELTGLGISLEALQELSAVVEKQLSGLQEQAFALAGKKFNFSSSKSVAEVLGMTKDKKPCTNKAALEQCDHPIANLVINWRKLYATHTKMVCPLLSIAERHSRIHSNCMTHTVTGRVSMHEPNLQNVPRDFNSVDNKFVISVRMAFVPSSGNILLSADYCQLELRILAHFSQETNLCSVLNRPGDVFRNIAARWYNTSEARIDDTMRQRTKQLCYGMIYGMGVKTLAETLQVDESEAREFLETFMGAYPGIRTWLTEVVERAREAGAVSTLFQRRRILPGLSSDIPGERAQAERQAVNSKIQGSAADIAKKAMVLIDERLKHDFPSVPIVFPDLPMKRKSLRNRSESTPRGAYFVLQLHDELMYEVNAEDVDQVARIVKESMEQACALSVPLPVKVKTGPAWGDLNEYNFD